MARPLSDNIKVVRKTLATGEVREYYSNPRTGEAYGTDRAAAEARFAEWRASLVPSTSAPAGSMADLIAAYYRSDEFTSLKWRTQRSYRQLLEKLRQQFGTLQVRAIDSAWIEQLRNGMLSKRRQCNRMLAVMRNILHLGKRLGYCGAEVVFAIDDVPNVKVKSRDQEWRQDQIDAFMAVADERLQLAMMLMRWTAQRGGDVIAMTKGQVSEHNGRLYIALHQEKTTKPVNLAVHQALEPFLRRRLADPKGMMLVPSKTGRAYGYSNFMLDWDAVQAAAGVTGVVRHDLRRTAVLSMAAHGVSNGRIRSITGHSSSTLDIYMPPTSEAALAAVEQWERGQAAAPNVVMLATKRKAR